MFGRIRWLTAVLAIAAALLPIPVGESAIAAGKRCASDHHRGGDWPSYGQNLSNTRAQDKEKTIDTSNVTTLAPAWAFDGGAAGGTGSFQTSPVIAEGCVYMTTGGGHIFALNADTGELVWKDRYEKTVEGVCCGGTLFAPTVKDGVLYVNVSRNSETAGRGKGPYVLAIESQTGKVIWRSEPVAREGGAYTNASTVLYDGLLLIGISGPEGGMHNTGGFAILEAKTGKILVRTHTVPFSQVEEGYGGGSIWTTAVVDTKTGYAFAGTGQPSNPNREHELINAIVKIDMDRSRSTFGEIVDAYKATPDSRTHNQAPCQDGPPETSTVACGYTDVDFGASPTLIRDSRGQGIVVEYQKSGVLHAAFTRNMVKAWEAIFAVVQGPAGNYTSTATDGKQVFGVGTYPGQIFAVDNDWGGYNWASAVGTTIGANPVAYANGVVYHADGKGFLDAYDSATGVPLIHRPMPSDAGGACTNLGGGVAIARNTVYAVCGEGSDGSASGYVIAYRLP